MPQGTSHCVSTIRDKTPETISVTLNMVKASISFSEMEDEIPMDIVKLMAKN